jgi:hypothetical protein
MNTIIHPMARWAFLTAVLGTLVSCSAGFNSSPYYDLDPTKPQKGVTYKLPRTVVDYAVSFTLYKISKSATDVQYKAWVEGAENATEPPVKLNPRYIGDERAVFLIHTPDLAAFTVLTKESKLSLTEDGVLTAANATFEDKTTDIGENFISSGLKFAKLAANPSGLTGFALNDEGYPKVERVVTVATSGQINYARLMEMNGRQVPLKYTVATGMVRKQMQAAAGGAAIDLPVVSITFAPETTYTQLTSASAAAALAAPRMLRHSKTFKGLWVRQPASVPFSVEADGDRLIENRMLIADAGPTTLVPIKSRIATDRSTTLTFHAGSGGLSEHSFTSTSQGERLSTSLETISDTMTTQVSGIIQAKQNRANVQNSGETLIIAEERKIEDANAEIRDIDQQLAVLETEYKELDTTIPANDAEAEKAKTRKAEIKGEQKTLKASRKSEQRKADDAQKQINYLNDKLGRL